MTSSTSSLLLTSWVLMTSLLPLTTSYPTSGATANLRRVVEGRCVDYKNKHLSGMGNTQQKIDCANVTDLFIEAFAGQEVCNVTMTRYDAFLAATRHEIPVNQSLFWNGVYGFVHRFSQQSEIHMMTLEDTLTGYMVNGLRFCASPQEEGGIGQPTTQYCPTFSETANCSHNAEVSFWAAASKDFATKARGVITIMMNASREFRDSSFLATWEMPNLVKGVVIRANIWIVNAPGIHFTTTCHSDSIKNLKARLESKNITLNCTVNPRDVFRFLTSGSTTTSGADKLLLVFIAILMMFLKVFE